MSDLEHTLTATIPCRFARVDKFDNYTFALSGDNYEILNKRLDNIRGKWSYKPLKKFTNPSSGSVYKNLIVKSKNIPASNRALISENIGIDMKLQLTFKTWKFENKTGISVKINSVTLINPDPNEDDDDDFFDGPDSPDSQ